jgi:hypothetical protein
MLRFVASAKIGTMARVVTEVTQGRGSTQFLFNSIPVLGCGSTVTGPTAELFTSAWSRAGHPLSTDCKRDICSSSHPAHPRLSSSCRLLTSPFAGIIGCSRKDDTSLVW